MVCPKDHKHALTSNCYTYHACRCAECSAAQSAYQREGRRMRGVDVMVPVLGAQRRLRALSAIGWTSQNIADAAGLKLATVERIRAGVYRRIGFKLSDTIRAFYEANEMMPRVGQYAVRARRSAVRKGWLPPLAWDDIDDPEEKRAA